MDAYNSNIPILSCSNIPFLLRLDMQIVINLKQNSTIANPVFAVRP
jgi:hypothetical protein